MVVAELPLVEVEREARRADPVVLEELPLRVAPEALQPVDVDLAAAEVSRMVDPEVSVTAESQRVIAAPPIRVDQRAALDPVDKSARPRAAFRQRNPTRSELSSPPGMDAGACWLPAADSSPDPVVVL